jgi:TolA-binding protein
LSLFQGNQGQWSQQEMASLRRMAGEQAQIQKSLEELAREANAAKNALGKLDEVGKQMGEVVNDMKDMNVDERTIRRQEQILTRLLDAQRSVREREYSPKRESRPGEDIVRKSPTMRNPHTEAEQLRQDLLKALEGHYVKDYERLIRLYFDALSREKAASNNQ